MNSRPPFRHYLHRQVSSIGRARKQGFHLFFIPREPRFNVNFRKTNAKIFRVATPNELGPCYNPSSTTESVLTLIQGDGQPSAASGLYVDSSNDPVLPICEERSLKQI